MLIVQILSSGQNWILDFIVFISYKGRMKISCLSSFLYGSFLYWCPQSNFLLILGVLTAKNFFGRHVRIYFNGQIEKFWWIRIYLEAMLGSLTPSCKMQAYLLKRPKYLDRRICVFVCNLKCYSLNNHLLSRENYIFFNKTWAQDNASYECPYL